MKQNIEAYKIAAILLMKQGFLRFLMTVWSSNDLEKSDWIYIVKDVNFRGHHMFGRIQISSEQDGEHFYPDRYRKYERYQAQNYEYIWQIIDATEAHRILDETLETAYRNRYRSFKNNDFDTEYKRSGAPKKFEDEDLEAHFFMKTHVRR